LRAVLAVAAGMELVGETSDLLETESCVVERTPDVLILDLNMPGGFSLDAIPRLREIAPGTQVVVLTGESDPALAREALRHGAIGYVVKDALAEELVDAVRSAARGKPYVNPQLGGRLATEQPTPSEPPHR